MSQAITNHQFVSLRTLRKLAKERKKAHNARHPDQPITLQQAQDEIAREHGFRSFLDAKEKVGDKDQTAAATSTRSDPELDLALAAEAVIANWESGDLADAVRQLDNAQVACPDSDSNLCWAARQVVDNWSEGDLAAAVRMLQEALLVMREGRGLPDFFSDYHEQWYSEDQMVKAVHLYLQWCRENGQEPEWQDDTPDGLYMLRNCPNIIGHIIYHAELEGFEA